VSYKSRLHKSAAEIAVLMDASARAAAETIAEDAKGRVPVATGRLRDAIHVDRDGIGEYAVIAGDNQTFYGHIVEHGGAHTPAQPFLVPALEANRAAILKLAASELRSM
jgi:HK97 gp10 family phage protein